MNRADSAFQVEEYDLAIKIYKQAIAHESAPMGSEARAKADLGLARCYLDLWYYPKALPVLKEAERMAVNKILQGDIFESLGRAYNDKTDPDSALIMLELAFKAWKGFPDVEREVRWRNEKSKAQMGLMKDKEALATLQESEKRLIENPNGVSAYEQARMLGRLAGAYKTLGWIWSSEKATKDFIHVLPKIPQQKFRWGRIVIGYHHLLNFEVGDSLTQRVEEIFRNKFREEHLCVAKIKWERITHYERKNNWNSNDIAIQNALKIAYGYNSIDYVGYLIQKVYISDANQGIKLINQSREINNLRSINLYKWNLLNLANYYDDSSKYDSASYYYNL